MVAVNSLEKGGRTTHIAQEVRKLREKGHNVTLLCLESPPEWVTKKFPELADSIHESKKIRIFDFILVARIAKIIRRENIDSIHVHCEASALYAGGAASACRRKCVMTFHRSETHYYQKTLKNRLQLAFVDFFLAISNERKKLMQDRLGLPRHKIDVLHWGIPAEDYSDLPTKDQARAQLSTSNEKIILSLGHLGEIKGHDTSVNAMPQILEDHPDAVLLIGGDGSDSQRLRLQGLIDNLDLADNVILMGQISNIKTLLVACDIFLQPSIEEGFGLVFLEAGACGRPTVATNVGGIPDIIVHKRTGLLVEPGDSSAVAAAVSQLLSDAELNETFGKLAKERILEKFNLEKSIGALLSHLA